MRFTEIIDEDFANAPEQDLFEMANLYPRDTGLPMTVFISPRGGAKHDVRVKVCRTYGDRMVPENTIVVGVRPSPSVLYGDLPPRDEKAVLAWVTLNSEALIDYWNGTLSTIEVAQRLKRVS